VLHHSNSSLHGLHFHAAAVFPIRVSQSQTYSSWLAGTTGGYDSY
jgi:hypothetical protein